MEAKRQAGRRVKNRASKTQHTINTVAHPDAAGIDIGAGELVVAVPPDRDARSVRTFSTFTSGVLAMRDWLASCRINTVAVESTGNHWITTCDIPEQAGIDVCLVNARHVKGVPGKKTDVCDAQWLQQLHAAGLLKKSFRPAQDIVPLRHLMRHRSGLIEDSSRQIQLMQKVLTEMNLKIQHVFSDIDGVRAQAIITAIVAGGRGAETLAGLRDPRCRGSGQTIIEALGGNYREEYIFVPQQSQDLWKQQLAAIATCGGQIEQLTRKIHPPPRPQAESPATGTKSKPRPRKGKKQKGKNAPGHDVPAEAKRFHGVDLSGIDGVSSGLLSVLMSGVGTAEQLKAPFITSERFCSWMGLCPDNRISGGGRLSLASSHSESRDELRESSRRQPRRREAGWGAARGGPAVPNTSEPDSVHNNGGPSSDWRSLPHGRRPFPPTSNLFSKTASPNTATDSAPDAVARTHCGVWKNCSRQGGNTSWKWTSRAASMRFPMIGSWHSCASTLPTGRF